MRMPKKQTGLSLIFFALILVIASISAIFAYMDSGAVKNAKDQKTANSLSEAKATIIGDSVSKQNVLETGYLRLPDIGHDISLNPTEGNFGPNFSGNSADLNVIGKFPWKSYGTGYLTDGTGECLWYVVSGRFKITQPSNRPLNWDTVGQIDVIDGSGNLLATNLAALVISPGTALKNQNRELSEDAYQNCRGNYNAKNYLDPFNDEDSFLGNLNYFSGENGRVASSASNTTFVLANKDFYNDRFLYITVDEIFQPIMRRSDFSERIGTWLDDAEFSEHLKNIVVDGGKGTANVDCEETSDPSNKDFCNNWKEMLLLAELPTPASIDIDGVPTSLCTRVLIFAGTKTSMQVRATTANISDPANYLEGTNLAAFKDNTADFSGLSVFDADNSSADIMRCL